jgi:hypothetical protein
VIATFFASLLSRLGGMAPLLGALLAAFLLGLFTGDRSATKSCQAEKNNAAAVALTDYQLAVEDGIKRAQALQAQLKEKTDYQAALEERLSHAPALYLEPPRRTCTRAAGPVVVAGATGAAGAALAAGDVSGSAQVEAGMAAEPAAQPAGEPGGQLSLGAVSLWNSALAGQDIDAGACRAEEPASPACAAGAGVGLDQVWRNHRINAASCAADRARFQALIDHLNR